MKRKADASIQNFTPDCTDIFTTLSYISTSNFNSDKIFLFSDSCRTVLRNRHREITNDRDASRRKDSFHRGEGARSGGLYTSEEEEEELQAGSFE
jgi:hypothetical protein